MKTEPHAAPAGPVFQSAKEVEANLKTRMEKAVSDLQPVARKGKRIL
ncbi:MAG: hypothetical protein ACLQU1_36795 [Bryobacteraceae bacterium]